jgi:hypothetical protein
MSEGSGGVMRRLVWQLVFKVKDEGGGAEKAEKQVAKLSQNFDALTSAALYAAGAIGAVYAGALLLAKSTAQYGEEVARISSGLDLSIERFQQYKAAFDALGASTDDITDAFGTLVDRAKDAIEGNKTYAKEFKRIGIAVNELKGKNAGQLFDLYIARAATVKDRTQAITSAVRLFGDDLGRRLLPVMVENTESLKRLMDMSQRLGLVLDGKTIKSLQRSAISFRELEFYVRGTARRIGAELAPEFARLADKIVQGLSLYAEPMQRFFVWIGDRAANAVSKLNLAIDDLMAALSPNRFGPAVNVLHRVIHAVELVVAGLLAFMAAGAVIAFMKAVGLAGAALAVSLGFLAGVIEDLWLYFHGGGTLIGALMSRFDGLKGTMDALKEETGALFDELKLLGAVLVALYTELTGRAPQGATAFEQALAAVYDIVLNLARGLVAAARAVTMVVTAFAILSTGLAVVRNDLAYLSYFFEVTFINSGNRVLRMIGKMVNAFRAMLELNPLTFAPANIGRYMTGGEVGPGASFDRLMAPMTELVDAGNDYGATARPTAFRAPGVPMPGDIAAAQRAAQAGANVNQTNNVSVVLPQAYGSPEADGRAAADAFVKQLNDAETTSPGGYIF